MIESSPWRFRARASLIHLGASAAIAAAAAALVFWLWYPWPYSVLAGGVGLFVLITSVDVVMGPLITLVVFDPRKPRRELARDLAIVIALQLCALGYGLHIMFGARPVVLAIEGERFRVVRAIDVVRDELPQAPGDLGRLSVTGPILVGTEAPTTADEQFEAIQRAMAGADLGMRPKFWRPWNPVGRREALGYGKPLDALRQRYADRGVEFDAAVARTGRPAQQLRYLPLLSTHGDWIVLLDAGSGDVVGFAPFDAY